VDECKPLGGGGSDREEGTGDARRGRAVQVMVRMIFPFRGSGRKCGVSSHTRKRRSLSLSLPHMAVHVIPMKSKLNDTGTMLLKVRYHEPLVIVALRFKLRRYTAALAVSRAGAAAAIAESSAASEGNAVVKVGSGGICRHYFRHNRARSTIPDYAGNCRHFLGILGVLWNFWSSSVKHAEAFRHFSAIYLHVFGE